MGCIGHVMSGSGLQELLQLLYSPSTVKHILSGKAVARALRGHLLVHVTLNAIITAKTFNMSLLEVIKSSGLATSKSHERHTEDDPLSASSSSVSDVMGASSQPDSGEIDVDSLEHVEVSFIPFWMKTSW